MVTRSALYNLISPLYSNVLGTNCI